MALRGGVGGVLAAGNGRDVADGGEGGRQGGKEGELQSSGISVVWSQLLRRCEVERVCRLGREAARLAVGKRRRVARSGERSRSEELVGRSPSDHISRTGAISVDGSGKGPAVIGANIVIEKGAV